MQSKHAIRVRLKPVVIHCLRLIILSVLRLDPTDKDALQTKLFLLLQTDQYATALALTETAADHPYEYERVYSLYRLQREAEAADILDEIKKQSEDVRGVSHLEAQLVRLSCSVKFTAK